MSEFEGFADSLSGIDDASLKSVSGLVKQMARLVLLAEEQERALKDTKNQIREIEEKLLPAALLAAGTSELTTDDGTQVTVVPFYSVTYPKGREDEVFEWLRGQGHGDLVKNVVSVQFGRQEDDEALKLRNSLEVRGYSTDQKQWVEPMTWKAFAREQIERGVEFPQELFDTYIGNKAKIGVKRGKR